MLQFVFNIYDLAGDGSVSRAELTTMLNHVPRAALSMTTGEEDEKVEHEGQGGDEEVEERAA